MRKKLSIILIIVIIIIAIVFSVFFYILANNISHEREDSLYNQIEDIVLSQEKPHIDEANNDFKSFLSIKRYGHTVDGNKVYIYCWIQIESYYKNGEGKIVSTQGSSIPYKFTFEDDKFIEYNIPEDGVMYSDSIHDLFPFYVWIRFDSVYKDNYLKDKILEQVENYYNISRDDIVY